ncbi:Hypothetical predicted protein [Podarcis lilfordi]|uniref:Uncharacterized protein n=1 Tax=Podarcis lilfordi TaxID=74358 RepID=A0AA35K490_9SAUR|nr:Hypothetical predicted protein [Podarcis lilfordi]
MLLAFPDGVCCVYHLQHNPPDKLASIASFTLAQAAHTPCFLPCPQLACGSQKAAHEALEVGGWESSLTLKNTTRFSIRIRSKNQASSCLFWIWKGAGIRFDYTPARILTPLIPGGGA